MAFCKNCGNQLPDGVAFCPKCGTAAASIPQSAMNIQSGPTIPPASMPSAPEKYNAFVPPQRTINRKKIVWEIVLQILGVFLCSMVIPTLWVVAYEPSVKLFVFGLLCSLIGALLSVILTGFTIKRRVDDPRDTRYEIGAHQPKVLDEMFRYKYGRFNGLFSQLIWIFSVAVFVNFALSGDSSSALVSDSLNNEHPISAISDTMSVPNTPVGNISDTTYFVEESDFASTLILEPDGTCAYLAEYATASVYYYGTYETTTDGVVLSLASDDGSVYTIPLNYIDDTSLIYTEPEAQLIFFPNSVYKQTEAMPESVQNRPPHSEQTAVSRVSYYDCDEDPEIPIDLRHTLVLNPDNSCEFLGRYPGGLRSVYGWYEITESGIILHLDEGGGSTRDVVMSKTANGFDYQSANVSSEDDYLIYLLQNRFYQCDEVPVPIARVSLNNYLASLPNELQPLVDLTDLDEGLVLASDLYPGEMFSTYVFYQDTITTDDGYSFYVFGCKYFDPQNGDMIAVDAQTGDLHGIRICDGSLSYMPLDEWITGYFIFGVDPWE